MSFTKWRLAGQSTVLRGLMTFTCLALVLGGCGSSPVVDETQGASADTFQGAAEQSAAKLQEVYEAVDGLTGQERRDRLIELTKDAGGTVMWYSSQTPEDADKMAADFEKATGVDVEIYATSSGPLMQRVSQEAESGRIRGDLITVTALDPYRAAGEGYFAELKSPILEQLREGSVHETWAANQSQHFIPTWNTNLVEADRVPKSYTDLFTNFRDGNLAFTAGDTDWFYGVVQILQDDGLSEDQAIELLQEAARGGVPVSDDHTLTAELLAAGQYAACGTCYDYRIFRLIDDGAPLAVLPPIGPLLAISAGTGISATAENPAGALLMLEYMLDEGQQLYADQGRTPTNKNYKGGATEFPELTFKQIDYEGLYKDQQRWDDLYEAMIRSSGRPLAEG